MRVLAVLGTKKKVARELAMLGVVLFLFLAFALPAAFVLASPFPPLFKAPLTLAYFATLAPLAANLLRRSAARIYGTRRERR